MTINWSKRRGRKCNMPFTYTRKYKQRLGTISTKKGEPEKPIYNGLLEEDPKKKNGDV